MIGNYTAIKRDGDQREYVDLTKKIQFKHEPIEENNDTQEIEENSEDLDNFLDKLGVKEDL